LSIHITDTIQRGEHAKGNIKDISELEWHTIAAQEAIRRLGSSETQGLDNDQAQRRLQQYGKNILSPPPSRHLQKMYILGHIADQSVSGISSADSVGCCLWRQLFA
jgi:sodium/potassium-transporting ATPase subunit alpha